MSKMEHRDTQQRVVIAVYRISCCKRGREMLLEEGAPESLIRLISKPNEEMRKVRMRRSGAWSFGGILTQKKTDLDKKTAVDGFRASFPGSSQIVWGNLARMTASIGHTMVVGE